ADGWEEALAALSAGPAASAANARRCAGLAHLAQGRWERAAEEFGQALAQHPADWQARRGRGRAHAEADKWEAAAADWGELLAQKPDVWDAWYLSGLFHSVNQARPDVAAAEWAHVLRLGIDTADIRYQR